MELVLAIMHQYFLQVSVCVCVCVCVPIPQIKILIGLFGNKNGIDTTTGRVSNTDMS